MKKLLDIVGNIGFACIAVSILILIVCVGIEIGIYLGGVLYVGA